MIAFGPVRAPVRTLSFSHLCLDTRNMFRSSISFVLFETNISFTESCFREWNRMKGDEYFKGRLLKGVFEVAARSTFLIALWGLTRAKWASGGRNRWAVVSEKKWLRTKEIDVRFVGACSQCCHHQKARDAKSLLACQALSQEARVPHRIYVCWGGDLLLFTLLYLTHSHVGTDKRKRERESHVCMAEWEREREKDHPYTYTNIEYIAHLRMTSTKRQGTVFYEGQMARRIFYPFSCLFLTHRGRASNAQTPAQLRNSEPYLFYLCKNIG